MARIRNRLLVTVAALALIGGPAVHDALAEMAPSLNFSGVPGLIDMPSGEALPDGNFTLSFGHFGPINRTTMSAQITPWLSGSFRIQYINDWNADGYSTYDDRGFDLRFRLARETQWVPALSLGLQDFAGTGVFAAEYLAATKTFGGRVKVTAGVGWGRLGSYNSFGSPFGDRPEIELGEGGKPNTGTWFRGEAAAFGGIEWQVNDRWTIKAEYSSDAYEIEDDLRGALRRKSPFNFGVEYHPNPNFRMGLYSAYGDEIGLGMHVIFDPKNRPAVGVQGDPPVAVGIRPSRSADPESYDQGWITQPDADALLRKNLSRRLAADGLLIEDFAYTGTTVQLRIRNTRYDAGAQAVGRAARALSHVMPASIETFEIVPVVNGFGASKVTVRRSDLESLEHAAQNDANLRERVQISDAGFAPANGSGPEPGMYPKFQWRIAPAVRIADPMTGEVGLRFGATYELRPGLVLSGQIYSHLFDNLDASDEVTVGSLLPPVRSDVRKYMKDGQQALDRLTMTWYAHPAQNIYTRVTFGYLERMHAGVSGEVLWKPVDSRLALGAEVNYTAQRDTDGGLGFGDYDYSIATGHVSAYYDFGNGFLGQVDVGRYLAGDTGATFTLDREFGNGWKFGAFASLTSATAEEYGEGSFDKGFRLTIPMNWLIGQSTRQEIPATIRPIRRDGGAKVEVEGRLYEVIRDYHVDRLDDQWSRVWR